MRACTPSDGEAAGGLRRGLGEGISAGRLASGPAAAKPRHPGLDRKEFLLALARERVDAFAVDFDDLKRELETG
jgi:hypothetical protein